VPTVGLSLIFDWHPAFYMLAVFGYPAAVLTGLPAHLLLRRLGWSNGIVYIIAGFVAGLLAEMLYAVALAITDDRPEPLLARLGETFGFILFGPELTILIGASGALAGLAFYLIAEPVRRA